MSTEVNQYRIFCVTENDYVYTWGTSPPTTCPNNSAHTIDTNSITIVQTVSTQVVKAAEDSDGYFETGHIVMNIPSAAPGTVSSHDVVWPMNAILWRTLITPTTDMIGDVVTVIASPETTIGVITSSVSSGNTIFSVNSTVTDNIQRGMSVTIDDGVNKENLGRCTAIDKINGTITVATAVTNSYAAGTPIKIGVYVLNGIYFNNTETIDIGLKGMKGKIIDSGVILRVYYTNNSGTSKTIYWRYEIYNSG